MEQPIRDDLRFERTLEFEGERFAVHADFFYSPALIVCL